MDDKIKELEQQLIEKDKEINSLTSRALKVHQKNEMLVADPDMAAKVAEMDYQLKLADKFIRSGAFPKMSAEQAFTIMRAGKEMGMTELEALNSLYIINGSIEPYGKSTINFLTKNGWKVTYEDETEAGVTVVGKKDDEVIKERVSDQDQIIQKSTAATFAKKNKMRFHGAKMILNFHLPHLIQSTSDLFDSEYHKYEELKSEEAKSIHTKIFEEE